MTRAELAAHVQTTIADAQARFTGVGAQKYQISENEQSFERASIGVMLVGLREEILDLVNYGVMLDILIQRRLKALADLGELVIEDGEDYVAALEREVAA